VAEDVISRALAEHKFYEAENFATSHDVTLAITGVLQSIDKLSDQLNKFLMLRGGEGTGG
jgi:hypothetical protein